MEENNLTWLQRKGEPITWYSRFLQFYLPSAISNLSTAYLLWLESRAKEGDKSAIKKLESNLVKPDPQWITAHKKYDWEERAKSFKTYQYFKVEPKLWKDVTEEHLKVNFKISQMAQKLIDKTDKQFFNEDYIIKDSTDLKNLTYALQNLNHVFIHSIEIFEGIEGLKQVLAEMNKNLERNE